MSSKSALVILGLAVAIGSTQADTFELQGRGDLNNAVLLSQQTDSLQGKGDLNDVVITRKSPLQITAADRLAATRPTNFKRVNINNDVALLDEDDSSDDSNHEQFYWIGGNIYSSPGGRINWALEEDLDDDMFSEMNVQYKRPNGDKNKLPYPNSTPVPSPPKARTLEQDNDEEFDADIEFLFSIRHQLDVMEEEQQQFEEAATQGFFSRFATKIANAGKSFVSTVRTTQANLLGSTNVLEEQEQQQQTPAVVADNDDDSEQNYYSQYKLHAVRSLIKAKHK